MIKPLAQALREGDLSRARALWCATTARLGVVALPEHEGELFQGVLVPREEPLSPQTVDELARSWERLDRAYGPCEDPEIRERMESAVFELAAATGLTADLGEAHIFVLLGPAGEAAALARFTGDEWRALMGTEASEEDDAIGAAFRTHREAFD